MNAKASSNVFWLGCAEAAGRIGALFLLGISSRMLSGEEFAQYILYLTFTGMFFVLSQMGTGMQGVRELCTREKDEAPRVVLNVILIRLACMLILSGIALRFHNILLPNMNFWLVLMGVVFVFAKMLTLDWALRAWNRSRTLAPILIGGSVSNVVLSILLVFRDASALSLAIAMSISGLLVAIASWIAASGRLRGFLSLFGKLVASDIILLFKASATIGVAGMAVTASQALPVFALNWFSDLQTVGAFGGVQRIFQLCLAPLAVLSLAHFPQLASAAGSTSMKQRLVGAYTHYSSDLALVSFWLMALLIACQELIIRIVLGEKFIDFNTLVGYVAFLVPLYYLRTSFSDTSIALGDRLPVLLSCLLGLIGSLGICAGILPWIDVRFHALIGVGALLVSESSVLAGMFVHMIWRHKRTIVCEARRFLPSLVGVLIVFVIYLVYKSGYFNHLTLQFLVLVMAILVSLFYIRSSSFWRHVR